MPARPSFGIGRAPVACPRESGDVVAGPRGEDQRDRRQDARRESASSQHQLDQRASGAPVPVDERMDRLELRVGDGGLRNRGQGVVVAERGEVGKQLVDQLVRRRHKGRCTRVVVAPANPVLDRTGATGVLREARPGEQEAMRLEHDLHADRSAGRHRLHGPEHRLDVPEDLQGGDIARFLAELAGGLGAEQPAAAHLQPLDPGGSDRFSAEQQPGECFGVGERTGRRVEPDERRLGVGDIGRDIPVEHELPADERVWDIDCVVTRAAIAACEAALDTRPALSFQPGHLDLPIQEYIRTLNIGLGSSRLEARMPYSLVRRFQADIRRRELVPTESADASETANRRFLTTGGNKA